jgi:hypothetical protein
VLQNQSEGALEAESHELPPSPKTGLLIALAILSVPAIAGLLLGNVIIKIAIVLIVLSMLYGWSRGLTGTLSVLAAMLIAILLARPIGGAMSGAMSAITGSTGILNRVASVGAGGLVIFVIISIAISIPLQRLIKRNPSIQRVDRVGGLALGLVEGVILALGFVWTPLALEPIASMQTADGATTIDGKQMPPNPLAERVIWLANKSRESAIGRSVGAINPVASARPLTMANDFLHLAQDERALQRFNESTEAENLRSLQSVQQAMEILESDQDLMQRIQEEGASPDVVRDLLESPTVLRILDETTILSDLTRSMESLQLAMNDALERSTSEQDEISDD